MYIRPLKAQIVDALAQTFDGEYPNPKFQNIRVSIEYPNKSQFYPSIWVDYEDASPLQVAGIAHLEVDPEGRPFTRWKFAGHVSYTVVALTSLERDELYDELVRTIAFGAQNQATSQFRQTIEGGELIGVNLDFDTLQPGGAAAAPGTPWGSDEIMYERTVTQQAIGEFVVDPDTTALVPLSEILITGRWEPSTEDDPLYPQSVSVIQNRDPSTLPNGGWI